MAADIRTEDYPHEIDEQLTTFDSSVSSVKSMLEKLMSMPRNELMQKVGSIKTDKLGCNTVSVISSTVLLCCCYAQIRGSCQVPLFCVVMPFRSIWGSLDQSALLTAGSFGSSQTGSDVCLHSQFIILE